MNMSMPVEETRSREFASHPGSAEHQEARFAMRLSLAAGVLMLIGKVTAYLLTHSAGITNLRGSRESTLAVDYL
jgi:hypothetical protein